MKDIWFTADTHFGHTNRLEYCNRPFSSVEEMNEILIENWNKVVKKFDMVYFLGDFGFKNQKVLFGIKGRLNGVIFPVRGNHDKNSDLEQFSKASDLQEIYIDNKCIVLCHYSMNVWNKSHHGSWHLFGHSHGSLPDNPNSLSFDVGVDCHNFTPISFEEVCQIMSKKTFVPLGDRDD